MNEYFVELLLIILFCIMFASCAHKQPETASASSNTSSVSTSMYSNSNQSPISANVNVSNSVVYANSNNGIYNSATYSTPLPAPTPTPRPKPNFPLYLQTSSINDFTEKLGATTRVQGNSQWVQVNDNSISKQAFRNAKWTFYSDGTFAFAPDDPGLRTDLYPLNGTYEISDGIIMFDAYRKVTFTNTGYADTGIRGEINLESMEVTMNWVSSAVSATVIYNIPNSIGSTSFYRIEANLSPK
jgi:hypothetical protein